MLRPITPGRLLVVFGCGGNRDRTKRPLMVRAVQEFADFAFATADNPRSEALARIFADMQAGVHGAGEDRLDRGPPPGARASRWTRARPGDCLLVAGKGHESYQEFADTVIPFDDRQVVRELIADQKAAGGARVGRARPPMPDFDPHFLAGAAGGRWTCPPRVAAHRVHRGLAGPCARARSSSRCGPSGATGTISWPPPRRPARRPPWSRLRAPARPCRNWSCRTPCPPCRRSPARTAALSPVRWSASPAAPARPRPRSCWRCCSAPRTERPPRRSWRPRAISTITSACR